MQLQLIFYSDGKAFCKFWISDKAYVRKYSLVQLFKLSTFLPTSLWTERLTTLSDEELLEIQKFANFLVSQIMVFGILQYLLLI